MTTSCQLLLLNTLAGCLAGHLAAAQTAAPAAGRLHYETTRRVDQNKVKITMLDTNGQEIKTDGPGSTIELPSSISAQQALVFGGNYAKEERASTFQLAGGNINITPGKPTGTAPRATPPPLVETLYFNLAERTTTPVTTIAGTAYAAPATPVPAPPAGWQDLPQTKRIAGYLCHKATAPYKKETYTLWVTTELPFAYSPVRELTPTKGVVLALSSDQEEYLATKLTAEPVAEADVRPSPQARPVTQAELRELRAKAQADFRQHLLEQYAGSPQR